MQLGRLHIYAPSAPRGPRDLPNPLSPGGITWRETRSLSWGRGFFVDLDRGLLHGDGRGLLMGVNAATSGGADVIFMDLEIVALSRTPSARVFAQVCTRLTSALIFFTFRLFSTPRGLKRVASP